MLRRFIMLGIGLLMAAQLAQAHHSDNGFDLSKKITIKCTVKDWQWSNPHVWLQVIGPDGKEIGIESVSPNTMVRSGFRWNSLQPGDKITVVMSPRRDGASGGFLVSLITPDGTELVAMGKNNSPPKQQ